jgi:chemotaxis protein CheZ
VNADVRAQLSARLRDLLDAIERDDDAAVDAGMVALVRSHDESLFAHVARLTRGLHQAVVDLRLDEQLATFAGDQIPDARSRLDYVMKVTETAAHRTLDLVDQARTVTDGMEQAVSHLGEAENVLSVAHPDVANVGVLIADVAATLRTHGAYLRQTLSELAQAQEYQDISGQIIRRVITLVRNVETALLELLRASGGGLQSVPTRPIQALTGELPGPAVPGNDPSASQQDADELLASLGF